MSAPTARIGVCDRCGRPSSAPLTRFEGAKVGEPSVRIERWLCVACTRRYRDVVEDFRRRPLPGRST